MSVVQITDIIYASNDVVKILQKVDTMSLDIPTMIPMEVLAEIDNSRNPMQLTRDRLERAATENQFMNGKIQAVKVSIGSTTPHSTLGLIDGSAGSQAYRQVYNQTLLATYPDLAEHLNEPHNHVNGAEDGATSNAVLSLNGDGQHG